MSTRTVNRPLRGSAFPETAPHFRLQERGVRAISERLNEPEWLAARRMAAWEIYRSMPMPSLKDDSWRRTDIRRLPAQQMEFKPVRDTPLEEELRRTLGPDQRSARLLIRPGLKPVMEGGGQLTARGVIFCDWATALEHHSELLRKYSGSIVPAEEGKFAALTAAMADSGALLYVPPEVEVDQPLQTIFWAPGTGVASFTRLLVIVDSGASITLLNEYASPTEPAGEAIHGGIVELQLANHARLNFIELQNWGEHVWSFNHERARLGRESSIRWIYAAFGSHLAKNFIGLDLAGRGAKGEVSGLYLAGSDQHLDHETRQNHLAPQTTSDLLFKGALVDRSRSVWQGMIYVAPEAQQTDGYQANRNLMLSRAARADSIPGLEILANDVRCSHGATVGRLEEEPIFYMMSRGLPRKDAERLAIDGFFAPIMERVPFEALRTRLKRTVSQKLT